MITPGSHVTFVDTDGTTHTEYVQSVTYHSARPAIYPYLSLWQRAARRLTPRRWCKPVRPVRPAKPATVTLGIDTPEDVIARHQRFIQGIGNAINVLTLADA